MKFQHEGTTLCCLLREFLATCDGNRVALQGSPFVLARNNKHDIEGKPFIKYRMPSWRNSHGTASYFGQIPPGTGVQRPKYAVGTNDLSASMKEQPATVIHSMSQTAFTNSLHVEMKFCMYTLRKKLMNESEWLPKARNCTVTNSFVTGIDKLSFSPNCVTHPWRVGGTWSSSVDQKV